MITDETFYGLSDIKDILLDQKPNTCFHTYTLTDCKNISHKKTWGFLSLSYFIYQLFLCVVLEGLITRWISYWTKKAVCKGKACIYYTNKQRDKEKFDNFILKLYQQVLCLQNTVKWHLLFFVYCKQILLIQNMAVMVYFTDCQFNLEFFLHVL